MISLRPLVLCSAVLLLGLRSPAATLTVTNGVDGGIGSLRERIQAAAGGDSIVFGFGLAGQTLVLTNQIVVTNNLTMDATLLMQGVVIDGGAGTNRLFTFNSGTTNVLRSLNLTGGNGSGGDGGAILNNGSLVVVGCALYGNSANSSAAGLGGAIRNNGSLAVSNSTISGNSAYWGGGVYGNGSFFHCTVSGNSATGSPNAFGGGLYGALTVESSIVAGNTGVGGADVYLSGGGTAAGTNIIQSVGGGAFVGPTPLNVDPLLNALADHGGLTLTRSLQTNSPALDGAGGSAAVTDQRGLPRAMNGDNTPGALPDIGAFEAQRVPGGGTETGTVSTPADEADVVGSTGAGLSLREALRGLPAGATITFDAALFNGEAADRIVLASALNHLYLASDVTVDAMDNTGGVTLDGGPGNIRILLVETNASVRIRRVVLTGGDGNGTPVLNVRGGAIYNNGTLALTDCTIISNATSQGFGGGILNNRNLSLERCTLAYNRANQQGGGIANFSAASFLTATNCTFHRNAAEALDGGGLANVNSATSWVTHCTFTENTVTNAGRFGGGIRNAAGSVFLANSIVTSNTAPSGPNTSGTMTTSGNNLLSGDAVLGLLTDNGGLTLTLMPQSGSPAVDAATTSTLTSDQRGKSRPVGAFADIGAVEACFTNIVVTNTANSGAGTLREALSFLCDDQASTITFDPSLSGQTIALASELLVAGRVTITAADLPLGITLSGNNATRVMRTLGGADVSLVQLTVANGFASGAPAHASGLVVDAGSTAIVIACSFTNNATEGDSDSFVAGHAAEGGAIRNRGSLVVLRSAFHGNRAVGGNGGTFAGLGQSGGGALGAAIHNLGALHATHNTFTSNSATGGIGGLSGMGFQGGIGGRAVAVLANLGSATLNHTTLYTNSAVGGAGGAGTPNGAVGPAHGSVVSLVGTLAVSNSIHAGNVPDNMGSVTFQTNNLIGGNPLLAPLGNHGGPTMTMPPLFGSPAIDAGDDAVTNGTTIDQRGFARFSGSHVDIGAVEFQVGTVVSNTANTGENSLRAAATYNPPGTTVTFASALSGQTITLTNQLELSRDITIDGSGLPSGITLSGHNANRILRPNAPAVIVLDSLVLANGYDGSDGGAIYNDADLTLRRCTVVSNSAGASGGALYNVGTLAMEHCTLARNSASVGGAIASGFSGAITAGHSTYWMNTAAGVEGDAILILSGASLTLNRCIVAGGLGINPAIYNYGGITLEGTNIVNTIFDEPGFGSTGGAGTYLNINPLLGPLGNYGGPTPTMPLLPSSPARNKGGGSTATSDQRGFPIVGIPDIGAYEAGTASNFNAWIWENLSSTNSDHTAGGDADGDGVTNTDEWNALTNPGSATNFLRAVAFEHGANTLVTFPSVTNRTYRLQQADLVIGSWSNSSLAPIAGNGALLTFTLPPGTATQSYFRVQAGP